MGLKSRQPSPKIKKNAVPKSEGCSSDQHPIFSFRYMTANKEHSIAFIQKRKASEQLEAFQALYKSFETISSKPWKHWGNLPKEIGYETISYSEIGFKASPDARLTGDAKMNVFRLDTHLGRGKGRIIGFKDSPCSAFNVIGYDFDFSAYDH